MDDDLTQLEQSLGISETDVDAIHMFELFTSLEKAGFNERQALTLVALFGVPDSEVAFFSIEDNDFDDEE
jgi:hypothetical protein